MTSVTKIQREAAKNAHHNDELILEIAGRNPRSKTLSESGWIKMSATMDSGAAETVAQIGRECVAHRTSTTPPLVAGHHRSAHRGASFPRTFTQHNRLRPLAFISSPIVSRSLVSMVVA